MLWEEEIRKVLTETIKFQDEERKKAEWVKDLWNYILPQNYETVVKDLYSKKELLPMLELLNYEQRNDLFENISDMICLLIIRDWDENYQREIMEKIPLNRLKRLLNSETITGFEIEEIVEVIFVSFKNASGKKKIEMLNCVSVELLEKAINFSCMGFFDFWSNMDEDFLTPKETLEQRNFFERLVALPRDSHKILCGTSVEFLCYLFEEHRDLVDKSFLKSVLVNLSNDKYQRFFNTFMEQDEVGIEDLFSDTVLKRVLYLSVNLECRAYILCNVSKMLLLELYKDLEPKDRVEALGIMLGETLVLGNTQKEMEMFQRARFVLKELEKEAKGNLNFLSFIERAILKELSA